VREDLAIYARLANASRDELRVLRAEVEDRDRRAAGRAGAHPGLGAGELWPVHDLGADPIVRGFDGDANVVGMRLAKSRSRDAHEAGLGPQLVDRRGADVAHTRAQSPGQLMHDALERPERVHAPFDSFRDELAELADVRLSVPIAGAPRFHRTERAHAAVGLEPSVAGLDDLPGRFVNAREKASDHDRRCAGTDRLGDVAGVLDAAVRAD